MATAAGQACMDQTNTSLLQVNSDLVLIRTETTTNLLHINNELGLLRNDQDAATATVMSITDDVAAFKAEQRVATTAHAERVQNEFLLQQNQTIALQAQIAALDLNQLLYTQGLVTDEKIRSAMIGMNGSEKNYWIYPLAKANPGE